MVKLTLEKLNIRTPTGAVYFLNHVNWIGFENMMRIVNSIEVALMFSCSLTPVEITLTNSERGKG